MPRQPVNLSASVHQRLLNLSQARNDEFNQVLTLFASERLLYRLSQSPHTGRFILKGALLFLVWDISVHRPTRDLDLLGFGANSPSALTQLFQELCTLPVVDDGLIFDPQSIQVGEIRADQEYIGQRVELVARLGRARIPIQVDIGFGDSVSPTPQVAAYPTLLEFPSPHLRMYAKETAIAEKLHAMVALDLTNSRMKDFYDIWVLSRLFPFDGATLSRAIDATFAQRKIALSLTPPTALTLEFVEHPFKIAQWQGFLKRNRLAVEGATFVQIITHLHRFLWPPLQALTQNGSLDAQWIHPEGWRYAVDMAGLTPVQLYTRKALGAVEETG